MSRCMIRCVLVTAVVMIATGSPLFAGEFMEVYPAVADKHGLHGSFWQTDLVIQPLGCIEPNPPVVFPWCSFPIEIRFYPFGYVGYVDPIIDNIGYNPDYDPPVIPVQNVIRLFSMDGNPAELSGALVIIAEAEFRAYVRSYNSVDGETLGHWVPKSEPLEHQEVYEIPYSVDRTNLMVLNLGENGTLKVSGVIDRVRSGAARQFVDIDPLADVVPGAVLNPPVVGFSGTPIIYAIATTVDNETNDATTVPLWKRHEAP